MGQAKHWIGTGVWVGLLACACGVSSCTPGELDEKQEKFLRKEIDKRYPAPKPEVEKDAADESDVAPDATDAVETSEVAPDDVDSNDNQSTEDETSEVATSETEAPTTSESSNVTSAESDAGGGGEGQLPDCFLEMVSTTCSGTVCHFGGVVNLAPNFESESLFDVLTTTGNTSCSSRLSDFYIDLQNPQNSFILTKVRGETCGIMPPPEEQNPVTDAELECLEGWLESL